MTRIGLLGQWLSQRNPTLMVGDNGLRSIAIGMKEPSGHTHYLAYIFETDDGKGVRVYSNAARNKEVAIADPKSFEVVYSQLMVEPALCELCKEARDVQAVRDIQEADGQ